jgi:hypothetical protein
MKTKLFIASLLMIVCQSLSAHDFEVDGIYYTYLSQSDKTVAVSFKGNNYNSYSDEYSGNVVIPESVTYQGTTYSVTSIGGYAFQGCTGLTSIEIPNSVTNIGGYAFYHCSGLTSIIVDANNSVYDSRNNCNAIINTSSNTLIAGCKNTIIPNSVTSIGDRAFSGCTGLTSIEIPNSVTSIGSYAFYECSGLTNINIPNSVTSIGRYAFYHCSGLTSINIPNSMTSIGSDAFYYCTGLTSINIPNSVTSIGNNAFRGCTGLTSIEIPNSVTSIGNYAFRDCTGLTSINIPNSVTSIGSSAFYGCTGLTSIEIPNSVTSIGNEAFYKVKNVVYSGSAPGSPWGALTVNGYVYEEFIYADAAHTQLTAYLGAGGDVIIPNSVTSIGNYAFYNCTNLTSLEIPNSVTSIGKEAFSGCTGKLLIHCNIGNATSSNLGWFYGSKFNEVEIGEEVTSIGDFAFSFCTGLTSIEIPNNVTNIGSSAFKGCTGKLSIHCNIGNASSSNLGWFYGSNFKEVVIGEEVTRIGSYAFYGCTGLTSINIPNSVTSIGEEAFYGCSNLQYNENDNALYLGNLDNPFLVLMKAKNKNVDACVIADNCKFIYNDAFNGCTGLSDIIIPENVTSIGVDAFKNCNNLKKVYNCSSLTLTPGSSSYGYVAYYAISVYNNCRLDGDYVITDIDEKPYVCGYLGQDTELTLPAMYGIGDYAFYDCKDLINVSIPNGVTSIGKAAFSGCTGLASIEIPNSVKGIGKSAFDGCTSLPSIEIPSSVTSIGSSAFSGCTGLTSIEIPNSVTSIGDYTFYNCAGLTNFVIPSSVTSIGNYAFRNCTGLTSIVIPSSVTSIGGSAFYGCNNLKKVYNCSSLTLTPGSSSYGSVAYYATAVYNNCRLDGDYVFTDVDEKPYVCGYLGQDTELTLPATYGICDYVFSGCTGLTSIEIPNSVKTIGKMAFEGCTGTISINCDIEDAENSNEGWFYGSKFSEVILGETVNKVGKYAFYGSTSIKSLTIGGNVNRIGYYAFDNCTGLKSIYSNAVNPPACRDNAFHEDTKWDCPLYVPKESLEAYKAANVWKSFLDIKENPFYSSLESIATMDKNDAPLYDLQGTQVVAPRPDGLYIRDGKKIILK